MKKGSRISLEDSEQRSQNKFWRACTKISANLYTIIVRLPWVIAIVFISAIVIHGLTQQTTVIKDISVPKTLAEAGYTPDVAGHRMRDALYEFKKQARTQMKTPGVALAGELPAIVVPTVGISLDAIVSSLRTLFRSTRSRTITGEVTINKDLLWLVLRIDGEKFYQSEFGVALEKPDDLFKAAAAEVMTKIKPYVAVAALSYEKPEAALLMAQQMLSLLPPGDEDIAWLHNLRARVYLSDLKDNLKAAESLELAAALSANRDLPRVLVTRGLLLESHGKDKEATAKFKMAVTLDPTNPRHHLALAAHFKRQNKIDAAISEFQKAIGLDRTDAAAHHHLGLAFASKHNFDAAIAEFQTVIGLEPKNAAAHNNLGLAFESKDNLDAAIPEYQKAIVLDPKDAAAHNNLGHAFASKDNFDAAIAEFSKVIDLEPKNAASHYYLGLAFASKDNLDAAIPEYQKAIDLTPRNADAHYYLGLAFGGDFDAAIAEYQMGIELHYLLGNAFHMKGNFDAAISEYQKAIDLDPKKAAAHYYLGHAFASKGNFDAAIPEYQTAIALDFDSKDWAHRSLGLAFASKGNFDEAIPEYQKAIVLDPTDTTNFDAAIAEYERKRAIDLDLTDARPRTNLGNVLKDATGD
jgi:tetratricopeptide (TPR) repeat protein